MKKAESLQAITQLWMQLPEQDRHTLKFHTFYHDLEQNHPQLLQWKMPQGGWRDREVKSHLLSKKLMTIA